MPNLRSLIAPTLLAGLSGCPDDPSAASNAPPVGSASASASGQGSGTGTSPGGGTGSGPGSASSSSGGTTNVGPGTGPAVTNCGDLQCSDNGSCVVDESGNAFCLCDDGYVFDEMAQTCVVDETCLQVTFLEEGCRQKVAAESAVALFFAVDFCAGTAVTPEKFDELGLSFRVEENNIDIAENVESDATILDAQTESYVALMLDVSNSVTQSEDLTALVTELRSLVAELEAAPDEPDVYVALYVFGRSVAEYVPFSRDFAALDGALEAVATDPSGVVELAGGGQSTALFNAAAEGINETQRIRSLRDAVTWGGVLSTGTVVVVTDGIDTSNATLDTALIEGTTNQVISIGISDDIDDLELRAIGRDGSFLAPTPAQWTTAFDAIATRVAQYPDRSYLLAYCSSASEGSPTVEVGISGAALNQVTTASCAFNAELFSSQGGFVCNTDFFAGECNALECGGLTGCGACADTQCCDGTQCVGPSTAADTEISCGDQIHTCEAANLTCFLGACVEPEALGDPCVGGTGSSTCALGVNYCDPEEAICQAGLTEGSPCLVPEECASLNCYFPNPDNPFEGRRCLPEARIGDRCGDDDAICESGAYCQGSRCVPKRVELAGCSGSEQCRQGECVSFDTGGNFCVGPDACYWTWIDKVPSL